MKWLKRLFGRSDPASATAPEHQAPPKLPVSIPPQIQDDPLPQARPGTYTSMGNVPTKTNRGPRLSDGFVLTVSIGYSGLSNQKGGRVVDIDYLDGTLHQDRTITLVGFGGYCHYRKDRRDFIFQNLEWAANPETGEIIPEFPAWFARKVGREEPVRGIKLVY